LTIHPIFESIDHSIVGHFNEARLRGLPLTFFFIPGVPFYPLMDYISYITRSLLPTFHNCLNSVSCSKTILSSSVISIVNCLPSLL